MASPIQIVLNPENYEETRETAGGGPHKDFFANRDREFREHKGRITSQLSGIAETLSAQSQTDIGYLKVILRRSAWAKSHRPLNALFKPGRTPLIGGGDLGVMIFEASPTSITQVANDVRRAEDQTRMRYIEALDKEIPYPSAARSELGAIERIEIYGPSDKRAFSLAQAIAWLSDPMTGSGYEVELFEAPPPHSALDAYDRSHQRLFQSFVNGLSNAGGGITVQRLETRARSQPLISIRLDQSGEPAFVRLAVVPHTDRRRLIAPFDSSSARHMRLLHFLDDHPLVRRVSLPGVVTRSAKYVQPVRPDQALVPNRDSSRSHPKVGVIDGGIGGALSDWVIERWDILADEDTDFAHGSFIGGLCVLGSALNGSQTCPEPDGAELVDLAVFPNEQKAGAFASYYPEGLPQFFDEVDTAISEVRGRHGVRIFNISLNILQPAMPDHYSVHAGRLDRIAETHDVLLFISAGNIDARDVRPEWPSDTTQALSNLAVARNDSILIPAESARNVAVGAVNPPGHSGCIPFAPTRFSRRGPGLRAGVKPDLAHVGGSGSPQASEGHGLFSITPDGSVLDGCGTSYATPLVAKTAAALDHAIEGDVSRETLIGLLVHSAKLPQPLESKALAAVARQLVGFGVPPPSDQILQTDDHEITLVFASRIRRDQQITFRFSWPACLVDANQRCRGSAKLTVVSTPPLDARFGAEFVRVNLEAALQQEQSDGRWKGRLDAIYLPGRADAPIFEAELIEHGLKWSPVKVFAKTMPRGVGESSNWRLSINYLTRAGETMPEEGVPFTAILTISDLDGAKPVFNDLRQTLTALGVQIADIRTAARITPRV
jgi:Subtilase family